MWPKSVQKQHWWCTWRSLDVLGNTVKLQWKFYFWSLDWVERFSSQVYLPVGTIFPDKPIISSYSKITLCWLPPSPFDGDDSVIYYCREFNTTIFYYPPRHRVWLLVYKWIVHTRWYFMRLKQKLRTKGNHHLSVGVGWLMQLCCHDLSNWLAPECGSRGKLCVSHRANRQD